MAVDVKAISELLKSEKVSKNILTLCDQLYSMTDFINEDYPKHKSWFYKKHLPASLTRGSGRDIIYATDTDLQQMVGTAFVKQDEFEKKICTLFVDPEARGQRVATHLLEKCFDVLQTTKPMITLADYKLPMFEGIIKKYGWEKTQEVSGLYNDKYKELVYNGILPTSEQER